MMWHTQPENSRTGFAITAGSVTNITFYAKTGVGTRFAQKTTSQKNPSLSPLNLMVMPLLFMSLAQIGLNRLLFTLALLVILPFKVLERLMAEQTCSPTRYKTMYLG